MNMRQALATLFGLMAATSALAADIGIMPTTIQFDAATRRATVQVVNNGKDAVIMQAETIGWKRVGGVDQDTPTGDLIVNPPVFTVQPGHTQIVRLGVRRTAEVDTESTYRMVLREIPPIEVAGVASVSGNVRVLVALRVPVYLSPTHVVRNEQWKLDRDREGNVVAQVSNDGNVHMKVARLRLHEGSGGAESSSKPTAEQNLGTVLFPGERRSFVLQDAKDAKATRTGAAMTLEVLTDQGRQYVALDRAGG
jgi:fimbrial chaperone protein